MPNVKKSDFDGDSTIGLHGEAVEDFCIMNPSLSEKCYRRVEETLGVKAVKVSVAGSRMVGIFCAANSSGVALPKNAGRSERTALDDFGIDYRIIKARQTALGNLILVNDSACVISPKLGGVKDEVEKCFEVPVSTAEIAGIDLPGASAAATNRGLLSHRDTTEEEMDELEDAFGLECGRGTVNFGKPFVGASLLANSKGVLTGGKTTGPELGRIKEALLA